jgi:DNA-binding response OmpR family regulator
MQKILIVDDDHMIREMCREVLDGEGYTVLDANNGRLATEILEKNDDIELVITDIVMPEKDGIQFIGELRRHSSEIKIIAISGGGKINADQYLDMARKLGADLILEKPFNIDELLKAIKQIEENE